MQDVLPGEGPRSARKPAWHNVSPWVAVICAVTGTLADRRECEGALSSPPHPRAESCGDGGAIDTGSPTEPGTAFAEVCFPAQRPGNSLETNGRNGA